MTKLPRRVQYPLKADAEQGISKTIELLVPVLINPESLQHSNTAGIES